MNDRTWIGERVNDVRKLRKKQLTHPLFLIVAERFRGRTRMYTLYMQHSMRKYRGSLSC